MMNLSKKIAVVGAGYWGKNLVRNFSELGVLVAVCDSDPDVLRSIHEQYPQIKTCTNFTDVLRDKHIDAVALATPAVSHYQLARLAIEHDKDVFVEKPLALSLQEAKSLSELVESRKAILMVDHLLQYHPAFIKLKEMVDAGRLGKLQYLYSNRLNIGRLRTEENILWSFAPHDISVILALVGKFPQKIKVFGEAYLQDHIFDTTMTDLDFGDKLKAHIYVSWLHPFKEQKLVVIGNYGMAVFNDSSPDEKLTFYPHKIEWIKQKPVASKAQKEVIPLERYEPLQEACRHFLKCVTERKKPRTDAREALDVLKILHEAQRKLDEENGHV